MGDEHMVRKPIRRSLLVGSIGFMLIFVVALSLIAHSVFSSTLIDRYNSKLDDVITFVEHSVDADDLGRCVQTKVRSPKYVALQAMLNDMVDDFELEYLYLVIPSPEIMTNVISATSDAERAAGQDDMGLLETTPLYSAEELQRYLQYWDEDGISYFEESSGYGSYYTAAKPLRDSSGATVALICADLSIDALHNSQRVLFVGSLFATFVAFGFFVFGMGAWIRKNITTPVLMLDQSTREFASRSHETQDVNHLQFDSPDIHTGNEIEALSGSVTKMTEDLRAHMANMLVAQRRALTAEGENARLADEARTAQKIAELSASVTSLFDNMPCLTFSKDAETGIYLACNQAFAEYAHKDNPDGVIGLTDDQIFDPVTAQHFIEDDARALTMDEPYVFFEDVLDGAGNPRQFQTTKLKFYDTAGRLCTLGMCVDVTELMSARRDSIEYRRAYEEAHEASVTYLSIARALFENYISLYYVDIETDEYVVYHHDANTEHLILDRTGDDFFRDGRARAARNVYAGDLDLFLESFSRENFVRQLRDTGSLSLTYRVIMGGNPTFIMMKASRVEGDEGHYVVGMSNVDAQMRQREATRRIQEERSTYARISAITGNYLAIYTVDPDTDHYVEYSAMPAFHELVSMPEGNHFFRDVMDTCDEIAHPDDLPIIHALLNKDRIMSAIRSDGRFAMTFRVIFNSAPLYVRLRAAIVEEGDGPQLIVGISDVDSQVKRDQEFARAQSRANRDALTGVKNKYAYVDAEAELNRAIEADRTTDFAIVVCDLNDLKLINDTLGHQEGDSRIRQACTIICNVFKHSPVFRVGGDEFVVILRGHDFRHADELTSELVAINEDSARNNGPVIAWGISSYHEGDNVASVFSRADVAMYDNKRAIKAAR